MTFSLSMLPMDGVTLLMQLKGKVSLIEDLSPGEKKSSQSQAKSEDFYVLLGMLTFSLHTGEGDLCGLLILSAQFIRYT